MPKHKQVTTCRKGGPISKHCSCEHCCLSVCSVCGAYEGGLTTDCPGVIVSFDRQKEVHETLLDYTDDRGWHADGMEKITPRFEEVSEREAMEAPKHLPVLTNLPGDYKLVQLTGCTCGWKVPDREQNPDTAFSQHAAIEMIAPPRIRHDWPRIQRESDLHHELSQKAIAWVLAERLYDDHDAALTRAENEIEEYLKPGQVMDERGRALHEKQEYEKMGWRLADQRLQKRAEEFHQAARSLVAELEK